MGLEEIATHRMRTLLTMLGIVFGVATFIAQFSIMEGNSERQRSQLRENGGVEKVVMLPRELPKDERLGLRINRSKGRTVGDAEKLKESLTLASVISPETGEMIPVKRGSKETTVNVQGALYEILAMNHYELGRGRFLCDLDQQRAASVCVVGTDIVEKLFPGEDPMGKSVTIHGRPYQVVGVMKHYAHMYGTYNALRWKNEVCYLPLTTVLRRQRGDDHLTWLNVRVTHPDRMPWVLDQARNLMLWRHGVEDFKFDTNEEWAEVLRKRRIMDTFTLAVIGGICLVSGGVGIMNIMLATVKERTREIGVRRALGARRQDIMAQFLLETLVLAVLGGICGVGLGILSSWGLSHLPEQSAILRTGPVLTAFGIAVVVCLLFGLFPAWSASKLDPIEALRYD